ncbi:MAG: prenyltransferase/squalene oxidase repeat-containing protein [Planctomycetota bacterium]
MSAQSFEDNIRALTRNSPWWLTSAFVHAVAALILSSIPVDIRTRTDQKIMVASEPEDMLVPEEIDDPEIKPPEKPDEVVMEDPTDEIDEVPTNDTDSDGDETAFTEGEFDGQLTGPSWNSAIGLGDGAAGGPGGKGGKRDRGAKGSSGMTENAVDLGLQWLADHQDVGGDGRWDADGFMKHDKADDKCDGPGGALYDVGVTGLSLLAFLGAGYTDRSDHKFRTNVRKGLRFLIRSQDDDGCFGSRASGHFMYNHAIAALAMAEAYWMTRNPLYKKPAQDGMDFISHSRNAYLAWRYEPRGGENDTSVTGWMVMALKAGLWAGLEVDPDAFEGARQWVDKMTDPEFGQVGYDTMGGGCSRPEGLQDRFPPEKSQAMTSVGMLSRIFLGEDPRTSVTIRRGADLCLEALPTWNPDDGSIDMYYWYYGTLAMFQVGGKHWNAWNKAMKKAIVNSQHGKAAGSRKGSWDPIGAWGSDGGRVYSTAALVLCLEVYYRYDKVIGTTLR